MSEDLDLSAILMEIIPGYVVVTSDGESKILFVPDAMEVAPGLRASVGFQLDGTDGELGPPIFLHQRMDIRHLGTLDEYLEDSFVQECLPRVRQYFRPEQGALPIISVIEALRLDPDIDVAALAFAVLERSNTLYAEVRMRTET